MLLYYDSAWFALCLDYEIDGSAAGGFFSSGFIISKIWQIALEGTALPKREPFFFAQDETCNLHLPAEGN